jgi:hypothetical protein
MGPYPTFELGHLGRCPESQSSPSEAPTWSRRGWFQGISRCSFVEQLSLFYDYDVTVRPKPMAERPPLKLQIYDLAALLAWYEEYLCANTLKDPRGHLVKFETGRFAYMIKLRNKDGTKIKKPSKIAEKIRQGMLKNEDFGGFDAERAQTLSWIPSIVLRPTLIATNKNLIIPGDELYIKEWDKTGYKYKVLYCRRMSSNLLVPVTSFPRERIGRLEGGILWPLKARGLPISQ